MSAVTDLFTVVWQSSLSATILVGLGVAVLLCFGKLLPAWGRYAIWLLVLGRLMMPLPPASPFSIWNLGKVERQTPTGVGVSPLPSAANWKPPVAKIERSLPPPIRVPVIPLVWGSGVVLWIAVAFVRHRRLARWLRRQTACADNRVLLLLDRAKAAFSWNRSVEVICNERFDVPAVFGFWRPRILLPAASLPETSDDELYLMLMHEMAHVRCRDTLLNWLCILVRSIHWFNPAMWYAFTRLRREREAFCDALVLSRLRPDQRTAYGNTLIKIAARISDATQPATLVSILQHKPEIHRRINMIAKYKPTSWLLSLACGLVLIALAGLTFTRAAEKKPTEPPPVTSLKGTDALEKETAKQRDLVQQLQNHVQTLEEKLNGADPASGSVERLRGMQSQLFEMRAEMDRLSSQYKYLANQSRNDLKRSIGTAMPDTHLSQLMQSRDMAEQKLADLVEDHAAEHPDVRRTQSVIKRINQQIEDRMDGMLAGLKAKIEVLKDQSKIMDDAMYRAKAEYREGLQRVRPYEDARQELRAQEELLQRMRARLTEQRMEELLQGGQR